MIAGLVALLVGRGVASWLASLIVYAVLALVALGAFAGVVYWAHSEWDSRVGEPYRIEGDKRTEAKLLPQIAGLEKKVGDVIGERDTARTERDHARADLATAVAANRTLADRIDGKGGLVEQIASSKKSVARWKAVADQLRATNAALTKKLDDAIARAQPAVDRAKAIVSGPAAASFEESCRDADRILGDLAKRMHAI